MKRKVAGKILTAVWMTAACIILGACTKAEKVQSVSGGQNGEVQEASDESGEKEQPTSDVAGEEIQEDTSYGKIEECREEFFDEEGNKAYYYVVEKYWFSDEFPACINETLRRIYREEENNYRMNGKSYADEGVMEQPSEDTADRTPYDLWQFEGVYYAGEDYVSLLYSNRCYMGGAHPETCYDGITIDCTTGRQVMATQLLGMSEEEIVQRIERENESDCTVSYEDTDFYLTDTEIVFFSRLPQYFSWEDVTIPRTGVTNPDMDESQELSEEEWLAQTREYEQQMALERQERRNAYILVLENIIIDGKLPDGSETEADYGDIADNYFCICDLDGDEKEELLIEYTTTCMAGMVELIYEYDLGTKELKEQFMGFPMCTYYYNGVIKEGFSHNQGLGPDFWPFWIHVYDPEKDVYVNVGSVDSWDKSYYPTNPWTDESFPDELDLDGDGVLYAISEEADRVSEEYTADGAEYEEWYQTWISEETEEMKPGWLRMSMESLEQFREAD